MNDLPDLLPDDDFGFRLTLRRCDPAAFFASTPEGPEILAERKKWLNHAPGDYAILTEAARPAWDEWVAAAADWRGEPVAADPVVLGAQLEPDVVLLCRDDTGTYRVAGGVVVFPSHWALADKIGLTLFEVHGGVPGLNAAIGPPIDRYLEKLKPGHAAGRPNWGLAATADWNLHPAVSPPKLDADRRAEQMWLRVERQLLTPLPRTRAVLFGIRIERRRLDRVLAQPEVRARFHRTLATMPAEVVDYKGLTAVRETLLELSRP